MRLDMMQNTHMTTLTRIMNNHTKRYVTKRTSLYHKSISVSTLTTTLVD